MPKIPQLVKCTATSKKSGEPCKGWAVPGGNLCSPHGGVSENPGPSGRVRQARRCKAHNQVTGEPCRQWAAEGQLVCGRHGGKSPRARNAAAMKLAEEKAAKLLIQFGSAPVVNSLEELQRLAGEIVAWKDTCRAMVNELHLKEIDLRFESSQRLEQIRSEVVLWERSLDRASSVLTALVRLGLDERLVGVREKTAENISAALSRALAKSGIGQEAQAVVRREFSRNLKIIQAA